MRLTIIKTFEWLIKNHQFLVFAFQQKGFGLKQDVDESFAIETAHQATLTTDELFLVKLRIVRLFIE